MTSAPAPDRQQLFLLAPGSATDAGPETIGLKAFNLARLAQAGFPVPVGFVLSTALCREYLRSGRQSSPELGPLLATGVQAIETATGLQFGDSRRPLLLAVRSGAPVSMPGMLETILNVGLTDATVAGLVRMTGNPRFAWDSYRRLVQGFAEVVEQLPTRPFDEILHEALLQQDVPSTDELDVGALHDVVLGFLRAFDEQASQRFPQVATRQLTSAVEAVWRSWESPKARAYRSMQGLSDLPGTAVTVQAMVFGNRGGSSGAGVGFTRDPSTGENRLYVDFALNAQGEDVVSGRHVVGRSDWMLARVPGLLASLNQTARGLEQLFHEVQDFEFTVEAGRLYLLQTRDGKLSAPAALRIACDMVDEGLLDERTALKRLSRYTREQFARSRLGAASEHPLTSGTVASPVIASGRLTFSQGQAERRTEAGENVILVRDDVATTDVTSLAAAAGLLTRRGARTSHAAVVARQLNKACIVGCRDLEIISGAGACRVGATVLAEGAGITLDGTTGNVYQGELPVISEWPEDLLSRVEAWRGSARDKAGATMM